jgi:hypothetical protein
MSVLRADPPAVLRADGALRLERHGPRDLRCCRLVAVNEIGVERRRSTQPPGPGEAREAVASELGGDPWQRIEWWRAKSAGLGSSISRSSPSRSIFTIVTPSGADSGPADREPMRSADQSSTPVVQSSAWSSSVSVAELHSNVPAAPPHRTTPSKVYEYEEMPACLRSMRKAPESSSLTLGNAMANTSRLDAATDYDMFTHNELRARGEARVGVHVWRPSGIHTVTGF